MRSGLESRVDRAAKHDEAGEVCEWRGYFSYYYVHNFSNEPFEIIPRSVPDFVISIVKKDNLDENFLVIRMHHLRGDAEIRCFTELYFSNSDELSENSITPFDDWNSLASAEERAALCEKLQECEAIRSKNSLVRVSRRMFQRYGYVRWMVPGFERSKAASEYLVSDCRFAVGKTALSFATPAGSRVTIIEDRFFLNGEKI